jgi:DNA-binding transcriptional regulator YiaG
VPYLHGVVSAAMTEVLEARREFDNARSQATETIARKRALLGRAMLRAREKGGESQATIARQLGVVTEQVRRYEQAYRDWLRDHPGETLD